jgi:hypothetical protein
VQLSKRFFHIFLRAVDDDLYRHLCELQLEPHLFGIRWLRLLFVREFNLGQITELWDGLFCLLYAQSKEWKDILCYACAAVVRVLPLESMCGTSMENCNRSIDNDHP